MALESLQVGTYTSSSDVWSFGVVLWEIFSMGSKPYSGILNKDITRYLKGGHRMWRPDDCPESVYKIMMLCWHIIPEGRPTFPQLVDMLTNVLLNVFSPADDYYSGERDSNEADAYVDEATVDCTEILREKRIIRLMRSGVSVTKENANKILETVYGTQSSGESSRSTVPEVNASNVSVITVSETRHCFDELPSVAAEPPMENSESTI